MPPILPFLTRLRVRSYELDALGHVNHAVYLNYFELARFEALETGGFPLAQMTEQGWGVHVVRIEVDYRRECRQGDSLLIRTGVGSYRHSSMTIHQRLEREGSDEVAAEARVVAVWVGANGRPMPIPEPVRAALSP